MKPVPDLLSQYLPILQVDALTKRFSGTTALDRASFQVPEGSLTVLLGPAGAGKTTTLRLIAGLDRPDDGRVLLAGQDVGAWEPKDRNIAMIFDTLALYPNKTGYQNIASPLAISGVPKQVIQEKVTEMARTLRVSRLLYRLPKTMSGGERQRIALGRALIRTPTMFLLDEPLSSLDALLRIELRAELKRLQRDFGYTFLYATPDFHEAMAVGDTVIMLSEGKVVQTGAPQEIYDRPADRDVAVFVGAPPINLIQAHYTPDANGGSLIAADACFSAPAPLKESATAGPRDVVLGIRPENLQLSELSEADIKGTLVDIEPLGLKSVLTVRNDAVEFRLQASSADAHGLSIPQPIGLKLIDPAKLLCFSDTSGRLIS